LDFQLTKKTTKWSIKEHCYYCLYL